MTKPVSIQYGPNLSRLGTCQPHMQATTTLADIEMICRAGIQELTIDFCQSNYEDELNEWMQEASANKAVTESWAPMVASGTARADALADASLQARACQRGPAILRFSGIATTGGTVRATSSAVAV